MCSTKGSFGNINRFGRHGTVVAENNNYKYFVR
jgi:hypothetical protein